MGHYVSLTCDVQDEQSDACTTEDSGPGFYQSVTVLRRVLRQQGWHRTRDGRDICPDCWAAGRR